MGKLITAGIGPIVMASIFFNYLWVLKYSNLIWELGRESKISSTSESTCSSTCFIEGFIYVGSGMLMLLAEQEY